MLHEYFIFRNNLEKKGIFQILSKNDFAQEVIYSEFFNVDKPLPYPIIHSTYLFLTEGVEPFLRTRNNLDINLSTQYGFKEILSTASLFSLWVNRNNSYFFPLLENLNKQKNNLMNHSLPTYAKDIAAFLTSQSASVPVIDSMKILIDLPFKILFNEDWDTLKELYLPYTLNQ